MKKTTLKDKIKEPPNQELKIRIIAVKERLPKSGITSLFVWKHPEFDTVKKKSLISNVLQLRQTDEDITVKLEALAETLSEKSIN